MKTICNRVKIASKLRKHIEKNLDIFQDISKDFGDFGDFGDLEDLDCLCGICSMALKNLFIKSGYSAKVIYGFFDEENNHCWVESGNFIFDITATQFGFPRKLQRKVVKLKIGSPLYKKYYFPQKEYVSVRSFRDWPIEQKPTKKVMDKIFSGLSI